MSAGELAPPASRSEGRRSIERGSAVLQGPLAGRSSRISIAFLGAALALAFGGDGDTIHIAAGTCYENLLLDSGNVASRFLPDPTAHGGGIEEPGSATLTITSTTITTNDSDAYGGGLSVAGTATLVDSEVSGNHVSAPSAKGGAQVSNNARIDGTSITLRDCVFTAACCAARSAATPRPPSEAGWSSKLQGRGR
jgi:hypothetical protein